MSGSSWEEGAREWIEPERGAGEGVEGRARAADELVVHGLLQCAAPRAEEAREARIQRVLKAADGVVGRVGPEGTAAVVEGKTNVGRGWRFGWMGLGIAAAIVIGTIAVFNGLPTESTATAAVQHSIAAIRRAGDHRFEVWRKSAADAEEGKGVLGAVVDARPPGLLVVTHYPPRTPGGVVVGRDERGAWAIDNEGQVRRDGVEALFPPWTLDGKQFVVDSLDQILEQLEARYDITWSKEQNSGARSVVGKLRARGGPQPPEVEVWINTATELPDRIQFRWDKGAGGGVKEPEGRDGPPRGGSREGGRPPGPPPHEMNGEDAPPRGPDFLGLNDDRGVDRGPPPREHGGREGPGGPGGEGARGERPSPMRSMEFIRVATPPHGQNWFDPSTHERR